MLSEKTPIPLGMAASAIGAIIGITVWLTTLQIETTTNGATLRNVETKQEKYLEAIANIENSLHEIKGELRRIKR